MLLQWRHDDGVSVFKYMQSHNEFGGKDATTGRG